jgi:hypothetical protein
LTLPASILAPLSNQTQMRHQSFPRLCVMVHICANDRPTPTLPRRAHQARVSSPTHLPLPSARPPATAARIPISDPFHAPDQLRTASLVHSEPHTTSTAPAQGAASHDLVTMFEATPETAPTENGTAIKAIKPSVPKPKPDARRAQRRRRKQEDSHKQEHSEAPLLMVTKPLPRVLMLHTGGTLGMDPMASYEAANKGSVSLRRGTGGVYAGDAPFCVLKGCSLWLPSFRSTSPQSVLEYGGMEYEDRSDVMVGSLVAMARALRRRAGSVDARVQMDW